LSKEIRIAMVRMALGIGCSKMRTTLLLTLTVKGMIADMLFFNKYYNKKE
jgi:hypothetical protein